MLGGLDPAGFNLCVEAVLVFRAFLLFFGVAIDVDNWINYNINMINIIG